VFAKILLLGKLVYIVLFIAVVLTGLITCALLKRR
jgi:hypothetical protein